MQEIISWISSESREIKSKKKREETTNSDVIKSEASSFSIHVCDSCSIFDFLSNFDVSQSIKSVADRMEADEDYQANVARLRTNRSKYSKYRRVVEVSESKG